MKDSTKIGLVAAFGLGAFIASASSISANESVENWENGKAVYETTCIACHGASGKSDIPGVPNFTKKKSPLSKSDEDLFQNILNGFQSPGSFMAMPPKGGNRDLTDQDILDVILYLREEFEKK